MEWAFPIILGVVLTAITGAIAWQIKTVVQNAAAISQLVERMDSLATKEEIAQQYVRRDDYVPQITQFNTKLDGIARMVARLDERSTKP